MAKKKIVVVDDGLKSAAVAVGAALGKLAKKVGLGEISPLPKAAKKAVAKKTVAAKKVATKKKTAAKKAALKKAAPKKAAAKKVAAKKAATKQPNVKNGKRPAKKK